MWSTTALDPIPPSVASAAPRSSVDPASRRSATGWIARLADGGQDLGCEVAQVRLEQRHDLRDRGCSDRAEHRRHGSPELPVDLGKGGDERRHGDAAQRSDRVPGPFKLPVLGVERRDEGANRLWLGDLGERACDVTIDLAEVEWFLEQNLASGEMARASPSSASANTAARPTSA